jgi:hypothetical protein
MMDLQGSHKAFSATKADLADAGAPHRFVLHRLPRYAAYVGLGLLGGAAGVALAIGLAILVQLRLPPPAVFAPGMIPLMVTAVLAGLGVSWLIGCVTRYTSPDVPHDSAQNGLQVILVSSVFASLAQVLFFFM